MHSNVTSKNVSWLHFTWATYIRGDRKTVRLVDKSMLILICMKRILVSVVSRVYKNVKCS